MLDYCYFHEEPLPKDVKQIAKLIRMRDECERIADVLQEFFIDEEEGYFHSKVNAEIDRYRTKSEKAKASAKARWDRKTLKNKVLGSDANALRTDCEGNAKEELRTKKEERVNTKREAIPYQLIADAYQKYYSDPTGNAGLVPVKQWSTKRKGAIKKLWNLDSNSELEKNQTNNIEHWERYFDYCSSIGFFQGDAARSDDHANWKASFDFLIKVDTYNANKERKYS
jgi:uncharacterized protein YdaU (DUF1376 family)